MIPKNINLTSFGTTLRRASLIVSLTASAAPTAVWAQSVEDLTVEQYAQFGGGQYGPSAYNFENIIVGDRATDAFLAAVDAGSILARQTIVGNNAGSSGTIALFGLSRLESSSLTIGQQGSGTLRLRDGAFVTPDSNVTLAAAVGSSGTLIIGGAAGEAAVAAGYLYTGVSFGLGTGTIVFNHTDTDYSFFSDVSGDGTLSQLAGVTHLTGNFGGFSGSTDVSGGTLAIDTALGQAISVNAGGTLTGTGSVGDVTFAAGSIYQADVSTGRFLTSTGTVTIEPGATVKTLTSSTASVALNRTSTLLTATNGVAGSFNLVEDLVFVDGTVANDGIALSLTLARNQTGFVDVAATANHRAAAGAAQSLAAEHAVVGGLVSLSATQALAAFDALSGEAHLAIQGVLLSDSTFARAIAVDRMSEATLTPQRLADTSVWGQAYGAWGEHQADGNAAGIARSAGGLIVGADADLANSWTAGLLAGYGHTSAVVSDRDAKAEADSVTLGGYATTMMDAVQVKLGAAYSVYMVSTSRDVAFGGFTDHLTADYLAGTGQIFGEIGYTIDTPTGQIEPFAGLAIIRQDSAAFAENGAAAALSVTSASQTVGVTTVGVRSSATLGQTQDVTVKLTGVLGWRHAFGDLAPQNRAGFASGGDSFTVAGAPIDGDMAIIEVGLDAAIAKGVHAGLAYRGEIGGNAQNHGVFLKISQAL